MPDRPTYPKRDHPSKMARRSSDSPSTRHIRQIARYTGTARYAELRCKSNFSFLRGASHPEQLAERASELGYTALAITDRHTLAGVVRMHCAAKACNLKLIVGAEFIPVDAPPITLYVTDRAAYGRLCRIITRGRLRTTKGACKVALNDIAEYGEGLIAVVHDQDAVVDDQKWNNTGHTNQRLPHDHIATYRELFGDRLYLAASVHGGPDDERYLAEMDALAKATGIAMIATNDVHYHDPSHRFLQDVLTCIRERCTLEEGGRRLFANAERHLKSIEQMHYLFADHPRAIARTVEIADRCHFSLDELRYEYPEALCPPGREANEYLAEISWTGARKRYPEGVPQRVRSLIEHELQLIGELNYEPYFLTVWDIVEFARSRNILCQGRGSAANSAVCYCLGITCVDPGRIDLLFERFVSAERNEPPDIDVDFEHERREEVFQYIYDKYGRDHAGIVAEVITYRPRSAIRDVGKTLGLSLDRISALAKKHEWWDDNALPAAFLREVGFDPNDRTLRMLRQLVRQIVGFPRHLSQHVGGFVITRSPLCEMVPIENAGMPNRTFIEWDKDDINALGILKIDCLALGMLTAIRKCLGMINDRVGGGREEGKRREEGTEGRRDEDSYGFELGEQRDADQDLSGLDCVAEGDAAGQASLRDDPGHARNGTVRTDGADAEDSGVGSVEHRRGIRSRPRRGLHKISAHCARLVDGATNTNDSGRETGSHPDPPTNSRPPVGNRPSASGPDPQPGTKTEIDSSPSRPSPSPSLPSSLPSAPSSLCPLVPQSLPPSPPSSLHTIPPEDPLVYDMICRADTVGVFQIESRAQMSMLPRLKPRSFYDLVIEVAIVRPGPIQGGMVHPYLRRRSGEEQVTYPSPAIREVLKRTLGVPLFQEQAMRLAVVAAGFTPGEADQLRRAMGAWRRNGDITRFRTKLIDGMKTNGLSEEFAERCFKQICGFGEYGFPESHAASFALLVYVSCWLKRYHPAAFCAALINAQPMGFYQPAQLVRDAREHGVEVLPVDVNYSGYDCRMEEEKGWRDVGTEGARSRRPEHWGAGGPAVRLGMRLIKGLSRTYVDSIEIAQRDRPFTSVADLARRSGATPATLARLAAADAMRSLGLGRRRALWQVLALGRGQDPPLLADCEPDEPEPNLPDPSLAEVVLADYQNLGLSLNAHPLALVRKDLKRMRVAQARTLKHARQGQWLKVAGLVLVRQRPSTAMGIVFCTLEDESGVANLVIRPKVYDRYRAAARAAVALIAEGRIERTNDVVHLQVATLTDMSRALASLSNVSRDFR